MVSLLTAVAEPGVKVKAHLLPDWPASAAKTGAGGLQVCSNAVITAPAGQMQASPTATTVAATVGEAQTSGPYIGTWDCPNFRPEFISVPGSPEVISLLLL